MKLTVLVPCVEPKFVPEIVIEMPAAPKFGDTLLMVGVGFTVNVLELLVRPAAVTTTGPVLAPPGRGTVI